MGNKILFFEEWQQFCESAQSLSHKEFCEAYDIFLDAFLKRNMDHVDKTIEDYRQEKCQEDAENRKHIDEIWGEAFSLYAFYVDTVSSFRDSLLQYLDEYCKIEDRADGLKVFTALTYINGRALQVANEILVLLRNGYADGAYARFRTLYELSIVAHFINHHGDAIAQAYMEYSGDWYDWAKEAIPNSNGKSHIHFDKLKKHCGIDVTSWSNEYGISNKLIHASPQGTFSRISLTSPMKVIPIGAVDTGIALPATNSLQTLFQINSLYFRCIDAPIIVLWVSILGELRNKCCTCFKDIEHIHFPQKEVQRNEQPN